MLPHQLQSLLTVNALCQGLQVGLVLNYAVHPATYQLLISQLPYDPSVAMDILHEGLQVSPMRD